MTFTSYAELKIYAHGVLDNSFGTGAPYGYSATQIGCSLWTLDWKY